MLLPETVWRNSRKELGGYISRSHYFKLTVDEMQTGQVPLLPCRVIRSQFFACLLLTRDFMSCMFCTNCAVGDRCILITCLRLDHCTIPLFTKRARRYCVYKTYINYKKQLNMEEITELSSQSPIAKHELSQTHSGPFDLGND